MKCEIYTFIHKKHILKWFYNLVVGSARLDAKYPPKMLHHCPLQLSHRRKYKERLLD